MNDYEIAAISLAVLVLLFVIASRLASRTERLEREARKINFSLLQRQYEASRKFDRQPSDSPYERGRLRGKVK